MVRRTQILSFFWNKTKRLSYHTSDDVDSTTFNEKLPAFAFLNSETVDFFWVSPLTGCQEPFECVKSPIVPEAMTDSALDSKY